MVDSLIRKGANINAEDRDGQTALTMAAKQGNYENHFAHPKNLNHCILFN